MIIKFYDIFRKLFVSIFLAFLILGNGGWFTLPENGIYRKLDKKWNGYIFIVASPEGLNFREWHFMLKGMIRF